jgi:hypothetical protein
MVKRTLGKKVELTSLLTVSPVLISAGMTMIALVGTENKIIGLVLIAMGVGCLVVREWRK